MNGSPSDLNDLLRAGVESARGVLLLSTKRAAANPDGNDNLADDTDVVVVASAVYKLNPAVHMMSEVIHGPHASYLRPCGTTLTDAEDSSSAFVSSVKVAAAYALKKEVRARGARG